ncbi:hypothetical protein RHAB21_00508 [Pseudorhizobium halotolerans]|uniref:Uncharacterized protein n=1 Tax=Pseudorhizobium halotolerans TaxID=1233081 RepID=A0ABN7K2H2_9HYPH|nr:hypothetical protein RHAB21_00508 [Pseudorhizobium halotolerans]
MNLRIPASPSPVDCKVYQLVHYEPRHLCRCGALHCGRHLRAAQASTRCYSRPLQRPHHRFQPTIRVRLRRSLRTRSPSPHNLYADSPEVEGGGWLLFWRVLCLRDLVNGTAPSWARSGVPEYLNAPAAGLHDGISPSSIWVQTAGAGSTNMPQSPRSLNWLSCVRFGTEGKQFRVEPSLAGRLVIPWPGSVSLACPSAG